jgi:hypothetical protein
MLDFHIDLAAALTGIERVKNSDPGNENVIDW